jgi:hypothetical protein
MIDWEDLTAADSLPSGRYFAGLAGGRRPLASGGPHADMARAIESVGDRSENKACYGSIGLG